ncbi:zinc metalloprotease [Streptomyces sp. NPDC006656]|uniref:zinc metalloprotease n=1 Tax=Streptomyces sp. NPDC006656 TaxID=3156899 RepID=UPI003455D578
MLHRPLVHRLLAASFLAAACLAAPVQPAAASVPCAVPQAVSARSTAADVNVVTPRAAARTEASFHSDAGRRADAPTAPRAAAAPSPVKVWAHVVAADSTAGGGNVPDSVLAHQVQVLNEGFAPTGFSFTLAGADRTVNPSWHRSTTAGSPQESAMKQALRRGGASDLNIYILDTSATGKTGWATFPWDYAADPANDGIVVSYRALPGGQAPHGLGREVTREAGHWLGLYNVFQGGCSGPGDYIDDTPAAAFAASGCPEGRDTCAAPGVDPIHNFMNYTDDACRNHFTSGQANRMTHAAAHYRGM